MDRESKQQDWAIALNSVKDRGGINLSILQHLEPLR
jgi:hypothetical protein